MSQLSESELRYFAPQFYQEFLEAFKYQKLMDTQESLTLDAREKSVEVNSDKSNFVDAILLEGKMIILQKLSSMDGRMIRVMKRPAQGCVPGKLTEDLKEGGVNPYYFHQDTLITLPRGTLAPSLKYKKVDFGRNGNDIFEYLNNKAAVTGMNELLASISSIPPVFREVIRGYSFIR